MSDCCGCGNIELRALAAKQRRVLVTVLAINACTFVMMVAASMVSGSSSLLSGTLDNFGDALTYGLSLTVVGSTSTAKARVAFVKGLLIGAAALAVAVQIGWRLAHPGIPVVETMGTAAVLNLGANAVCLWLLSSFRSGDVNMASAWECSRNDVYEGGAVILTTFLVWLFSSGWPDLLVATALLVVFVRSATRVLRAASKQLRNEPVVAR